MTGGEEKFAGDMERLVIEVTHVFFVELFGLRVGFGDGDELQKPGAVGIRFDTAIGDELPEPIHDASADNRPIVTQEAVAVVMLRCEFPGAQAAQPRDPYRRMWFLDRVRPDIDHWQLEV